MSRSSTASGRLVHMSDLPHKKIYDSRNRSHLLPIHYPSLKENIISMIYNQCLGSPFSLFLLDQNLTLTSNNYTEVKGGWCQDIDAQFANNSEQLGLHYKQSFDLGIIILNYLHTLAEVSAPKKQQETLGFQQFQLVAKGKSFTYCSRYPSFQHSQTDSASRLQGGGLQLETLNMEKPPQSFRQAGIVTVSFNIYKKKGKFIFLTGRNNCPTSSFFQALTVFRQWNISRLKTSSHLIVHPNKLFRLGAYVQHIFTIGRGFLLSAASKLSESWFNLTNDSNENAKYLKVIAQHPLFTNQLQNPSSTIAQLQKSHSQIISLLDDTLSAYRLTTVYKQEIFKDNQIFLRVLTTHLARFLAKIFSQMPINVGLSYHCRYIHNQNINQITLLFLVNFKSTTVTHIYSGPSELIRAQELLVKLVNKQNYEAIVRRGRDLADQLFENSFKIFHKYNNKVSQSQFTNSLIHNESCNLKVSPVKLVESKYSPVKALQESILKNKLLEKETNDILSAEYTSTTEYKYSQAFCSLVSGEIGIEVLKLMESIENRKQRGSLLSSTQINNFLKCFLEPFSRGQQSNQFNGQQKSAAKYVGECCSFLPAQDILLLIEQNEADMGLLLDFFVQENSYSKMLEIALEMGKKYLEELFRSYLQRSFSSFRYHLILNFLKKFLAIYFRQQSHRFQAQAQTIKSPYPVLGLSQQSTRDKFALRNLQSEKLLGLLDNKDFNSPAYRKLAISQLESLFSSKLPQIDIFGSLLLEYGTLLRIQDHHPDLIASFIGQFFFQIVFFTQDSPSIALSNSAYRYKTNTYSLSQTAEKEIDRNAIDLLKQKKLLQLLREGGFLRFGQEIRDILWPLLENANLRILLPFMIVSTIRVNPLVFKEILGLLSKTKRSENLAKIRDQILKKSPNFKVLEREVCVPFYRQQLQEKDFEENQKNQISLQLSQSSLFKELLAVNQEVKIAGRNLREEYHRKIRAVEQQSKKFTTEYFQKRIMKIQLQKGWEYVKLAEQGYYRLKQWQQRGTNRGIKSQLGKLDKGSLYLEETLQHIYSELSTIYQYLGLNDLVKTLISLPFQYQEWVD